MGLLSRVGRRFGRFAGSAAEQAGANWKWNQPLGTGAYGAALGGAIGAGLGGASQQTGAGGDPMSGALAGAAVGAGGAAGLQAMRALSGGLAHGIAEMLRMAPYSGPGFEQVKRRVAQQVAGFSGDAGMPLMQGAAREDAEAAAQQLMTARNADELLDIAAQLEQRGGNVEDAMGGAAHSMSGF